MPVIGGGCRALIMVAEASFLVLTSASPCRAEGENIDSFRNDPAPRGLCRDDLGGKDCSGEAFEIWLAVLCSASLLPERDDLRAVEERGVNGAGMLEAAAAEEEGDPVGGEFVAAAPPRRVLAVVGVTTTPAPAAGVWATPRVPLVGVSGI